MQVDLKPVIYQLVVRYFGNTHTRNQLNGSLGVNGCGRFAHINAAALAAIKQLGITHIWLTGCLRQATLTDFSSVGLPPDDPDVVKGIAGSFYAVSDYFDVCPDYATNPANRLSEFDALVNRIHSAGMKALIDFVPNHVARGYRSVVRAGISFGIDDDTTQFFHRDNHYFYLVDPPAQQLQLSAPEHWTPPDGFAVDGKFAHEDGVPGRPPKATGNNVTSSAPSADDWYETVKLNYGYDFVARVGHYSPTPRTWTTVDQILSYWQARGVDGFRCDFAHYIPPEAWAFLINKARIRNSDTFFIAEAYPFPGSGDPIVELRQLVDAGFDAVYHDESYDRLKLIYQGREGQDHYDQTMVFLPLEESTHAVEYLENHDERRIASPISNEGDTSQSGFGSADAGYQLAPLQYLYGAGPVLILNGQEVGEPGAGSEGYSVDDGRTTIFDYWCMPEFSKWVNGHAYDGGELSSTQRTLRRFYADLFALCQDPSIRADGYWGLKYFNRPEMFPDCPTDLYTVARYQTGAGRLVIVAANFRPHSMLNGRVRIPQELATAVGLAENTSVHLLLDRDGANDIVVLEETRRSLVEAGFPIAIPNQSTHVYLISSSMAKG